MKLLIDKSSVGSTKASRRSGFSFVEILIALAILIISVVSLLNFLTIALRVDHTSSAVTEDLLYKSGSLEARASSQSRSATVTVGEVEISGNLYEIEYGRVKRLIEFERSE
ncbi:MAG TPA: hypothetical protein ENN47_02230 [Mesotoga infera]|uniref:Prepilin-type N-terminal cleavage/methylation domain-containing protein n=1 Tax=Mesotoga infera TaxID=1236046 RepID=A0A7C1H515_9BACT|nr:hypothetical protein [Mesotoga infera]